MPTDNYLIFNPRNPAYGAHGDGINDDTAAFQACLADAAAVNAPVKIVLVPPGRYLFASGNLLLKTGIVLQGSYSGPISHGFRDGSFPPAADGTIFLITYTGNPNQDPFCQLQSNAEVRGISFMWPNQNVNNPPIAYPYAIGKDPTQTTVVNITIANIELMACYNGINLNGCNRHNVNGVVGQVFNVGVLIDNVSDVGRVQDVHFHPYWSGWNQGADGTVMPAIANWQFQNGTGYLIRYTDSQMFRDCFVFGYNRGVWFNAQTSSQPNCLVHGLSVDTCRIGVQIDAAAQYTGLQFTNCFITGEQAGTQTLPGGAAILISAGVQGNIRFTTGTIWGISPAVVSNGANVMFTDYSFNDTPAAALFSMTVTGGTMVVTNCQFLRTTNHISLSAAVSKAIVLGNVAPNASSLFVLNVAPNALVVNNL
jgi:hypothetical protein